MLPLVLKQFQNSYRLPMGLTILKRQGQKTKSWSGCINKDRACHIPYFLFKFVLSLVWPNFLLQKRSRLCMLATYWKTKSQGMWTVFCRPQQAISQRFLNFKYHLKMKILHINECVLISQIQKKNQKNKKPKKQKQELGIRCILK